MFLNVPGGTVRSYNTPCNDISQIFSQRFIEITDGCRSILMMAVGVTYQSDKQYPASTSTAMIRRENLIKMKAAGATEEMLSLKGIHPEFGEVTLRQLLATWVVHDLAHLCQVTRVMAKQYGQEIGPWAKYFSIFNQD
jgi:hypothetical protein